VEIEKLDTIERMLFEIKGKKGTLRVDIDEGETTKMRPSLRIESKERASNLFYS